MFFGHLSEILVLLVLALIVFGPKRMIQMGSQLGKMWRELQSAMKDMNWSLTGEERGTRGGQSTLSKLSQFSQDMTARVQEPSQAPSTSREHLHVVEAPAPEETPPSNQG